MRIEGGRICDIFQTSLRLFQSHHASSDRDLFLIARKLKFQTFEEFLTAVQENINNYDVYREFIDSGYKSYEDYRLGKGQHFTSAHSFYEARELGLQNEQQLVKYRELEEEVRERGFTCIEEVSLQDILERMFSTLNTPYRLEQILAAWMQQLPNWFRTQSLPVPANLSGPEGTSGLRDIIL